MAGGPIAVMVHYLLVPHVVCEHGELVEVTHPAARTSAAVQHSQVPTASPDGGELFGFDHHHCTMAATGRVLAALHGPAACLFVRVSVPRALPAVLRSSRDSGPSLLALAPKTSPPLA